MRPPQSVDDGAILSYERGSVKRTARRRAVLGFLGHGEGGGETSLRSEHRRVASCEARRTAMRTLLRIEDERGSEELDDELEQLLHDNEKGFAELDKSAPRRRRADGSAR